MKNQPKAIVIIPARGQSKRLSLKNSKTFGKHPLLAHSILYAKKFKKLIDAIYVTTDDLEIKKIAQQYGALVIDRPKELSGDKATTVSAIKHVLQKVKEQYEIVIILQPTNPLRPKDLLKKAYQFYLKQNCDSVMTVSRNNYKLGKIKNNKFVPFNYKTGQRSQDLEPLYFENGLLYITKASVIIEGKIVGDNNKPFIVEHPYANVDIDTEEDFNFAQYILKQYPDE